MGGCFLLFFFLMGGFVKSVVVSVCVMCRQTSDSVQIRLSGQIWLGSGLV